jgi:hypothetical protein
LLQCQAELAAEQAKNNNNQIKLSRIEKDLAAERARNNERQGTLLPLEAAAVEHVEKLLHIQNSIQVERIHTMHSDAVRKEILESSLAGALGDCGLYFSAEELALIFRNADLNNNGGLNLDEFRIAVKTPTKLEQWAGTLALSRLLAHCLMLRISDLEDPLLDLSELSRIDLEYVSGVFCEGIRKILADAQIQLKKSLAAMRETTAESSAGAGSKFQTFKMSCGKVEDFHKGLKERVGATPWSQRTLLPC